MAFKDIPGNLHVKQILRKSLQKRGIPNSLLFTGPEGVGKKEVAMVIAKALNCEKKEDDACETCAPCRAISKGNFPDVITITPGGNVVKIDQIRLVKQTAYLKPMVGKKRVFIVTEAEKMTEEAANSFLKILEEPPSFSHIILVTNNSYLILPTIKSRCQILCFSPVSKEEIEKILIERGHKKEHAKLIPLLVRGNLEHALSLEWEEVLNKRRKAWKLFLSLLKKNEMSLFLKDYTFYKKNIIKDELEEILELISSFCRDCIVVKEKGDFCFLLNPDYIDKIREEEKHLSLNKLMDYLNQIDFTLYALRKNLNVNLLISSFFSSFMEKEHA
ncbi:MAG: DNA polymerase III subunit delta' [Candidatus Aminicenantaceae bacterium]